ncbi:MAG: SDR family oxidoreductase [Gemmatirosa sp.]|nr:SDR family oxidoreductase [Gemmatirosa sp.]
MGSASSKQGAQVVLITGASSGIGLECARYLAERGYRVYGTSRRDAPTGERFTMLRMDVTDDGDVARTVDTVMQAESRIDVLVNNAGYGIAGAVEDTTVDEARAQFETNVLGPLRMCRAVLPHMRTARSGLIVNVSSIAGLVPVPFQAFYSASKAAIESMSEALRMEVRPFGIRVALLEPGDFRTGFTANRVRVAASAGSPYQERFERALGVMERDESKGAPPAAIARELERVIQSPAPAFRTTIGAALQRAAPTLRNILPYGLYERMLMQTYEIHR